MSKYRLGIIFLFVGLSLGIATIIRGMTPFEGGTHLSNIPGHTVPVRICYMIPPMNLRLDITCDGRINLSLLPKNSNNPIFTAENISQGVYRVKIPRRGEYCFLIENLSDSPTSVHLGFTLYRYERDLLYASIISSILGGVTIVFIRLRPAREESSQS
ncbi:MAG: hypothetical protein ACETVR_02090 [Candidatus Bathyarchaeia archaeon]